MDKPLLQAFVAVAQRRSFSEAAFDLYISQSAVSKRITQLEYLTDTRLFDRLGRRVELTEAGIRFFPHAKDILHRIDNAIESLNQTDGLITGALRVATSHHIGLHRLPPILKQFKKHYPQVKIHIQFMASEAAYERVIDGQIDLAVVTLTEIPQPIVKITPLWIDKLLCVANHQDILTKGSNIPPAALTTHPALLPEKGTITRNLIEQWFSKYNANLTTSLETNYLETIKTMTYVGLGWSVLPSIMIDNQLKVIDVEGFDISRSLGIITHRNKTFSRATQAFIETSLEYQQLDLVR